jgi:hypothetical protein
MFSVKQKNQNLFHKSFYYLAVSHPYYMKARRVLVYHTTVNTVVIFN